MNARKKRICYNIISSLLVIITLTLSFFALINIVFNFVYIKTPVRGFSMQPTLNAGISSPDVDGDIAYINKYGNFSSNDIVVAKVDWWAKGHIIKRLVATPGDKLKIIENEDKYILIVNGKEVYSKDKNVSEYYLQGLANYYNHYLNYITSKINTASVEKDSSDDYVIVMQDNEYFLMGDNWAESEDCVRHGPVSKEEIVGRVDVILKYDENKVESLMRQILQMVLA